LLCAFAFTSAFAAWKGVTYSYYCDNCNAQCEDLNTVGANWWWNWDFDPHGCAIDGPEFVPMIWSRANVGNLNNLPNTPWVQGFNEPNYNAFGQDNFAPSEGAALWGDFVNTGKNLASPGVALCWYGGDANCVYDGPQWLSDFIGNISGQRLNALVGHIYTTDVGVIENALQNLCNIASNIGAEVWLTEFNAGSDNVWDHVNVMNGVIPWMNGNGCVTRYAWVSARDPSAGSLVDVNSGQLTDPVGTTFVSL